MRVKKNTILKIVFAISFLISSMAFYEFVIFLDATFCATMNAKRTIAPLFTFFAPSIFTFSLFLIRQSQTEEQMRKRIKYSALFLAIYSFIFFALTLVFLCTGVYSKVEFFGATALFPFDILVYNFLNLLISILTLIFQGKFQFAGYEFNSEGRAFRVLDTILFIPYYLFAAFFFGSFLDSPFLFLNWGGEKQGLCVFIYLALLQCGLLYLFHLKRVKNELERDLIIFCVSLISAGLFVITLSLNPDLIVEELSPFFPLEVQLRYNVAIFLVPLTLITPSIYFLSKDAFKRKETTSSSGK